ncbi:nitrite reductase (NO-forming) [Homoserinimonas aerilata]|uniref:Copper-containing nitrite reductase n=1 Tax=Homoserinimonas aerilata TaxID=1162970 RepID=A0A542YAI3_9MICO|nr:multicopper oxidase domain-containing protein [Homoserinimonas aerilata]TQL45053.1 nitrite reductase (NO-forming) [Homoserinimonas aerilata]
MTRRGWYLAINSLVLLWVVATALAVLFHRFLPVPTWLMVHLTVLGAATTAILIWSQHFADTLLRRPARGGRVALAVRLGIHTLGAATVIGGMMTGVWPVTIAGGALVALAAVLHSVSLFVQGRGALPSRFGHLVRYYVAAGLVLVVGVAAGVLLAGPDASPWSREQLHLAHIALNVLGWVGLTVVGTVILLWPTILHARIQPQAERAASFALAPLLFGLALIVVACLSGYVPLVAMGVLVYLAGLSLVLIEAVKQAIDSPPRTYAAYSMAAALLWFFGSVLAFGVLVIATRDWSALDSAVDALIIPFVAGFIAQIVIAALSHLVPVVLGGGPAVSRLTARELDRGSVFRVIVINGGMLLYLFPLPGLVKIVLSFVVFAVLLSFVVFALRAVRIARRGVAEATDAGPQPQIRSRSGMVVTAAGALVLAVVVGVAIDPTAAGIGAARPDASVQETGHTTTVQMTMKDMRFSPDVVEVPAGDRLVIELSNLDADVHDLAVENGVASGRLAKGQHETVDVGIITTDLEGWCSIAPHRQMGMVFSIVVTGASASSSATPSASPDAEGGEHSGHGMSHGSGASAAADFDPMKVAPDGFEARDASLPAASAETVHRVALTVTEEEVEVAPGVTQLLWLYNGQAPGPTLRGRVGDRFIVTLSNDSEMGHSIDFHAGALAPDEPMRTIGPGESLEYAFTATRSGAWLYHCSTMPMSVHIANGMFGAVIIDPPDLAPVDREYVMVQSEFYLGAQGEIADAEKVLAKQPDMVAFNGYANQYRDRPLEARVGERVRVWVVDAGPNLFTSFHVVGGQFDTVFAESDYRLRDGGSTGTGGSQTLALGAAQGGFVELTFPEAGTYPFVTHIMADAEHGATGAFRVK